MMQLALRNNEDVPRKSKLPTFFKNDSIVNGSDQCLKKYALKIIAEKNRHVIPKEVIQINIHEISTHSPVSEA